MKVLIRIAGVILGVLLCPNSALPQSIPPEVSRELCGPTSDPKIPKILHQIWINKDSNKKPPAKFLVWSEQFRRLHPDWDYLFWDDISSREFIKTHYPSFVETFENYDVDIKRADVLRYLLMHHFGGVYVDLSFQLVKKLDRLLGNCSVVLAQSTTKPEEAGGYIGNAFMASVPGLDLWQNILLRLEASPKDSPDLPDSKDKHVLYATGPYFLTAAITELGLPQDSKIYHPEYVYPFHWEDKDPTALSCRKNPKLCPRLYPRAFLIKHWSGLWLKEYERSL